MPDVSEITAALRAWRDWELSKGASAEALPGDAVLLRIATKSPASAESLRRAVAKSDADTVQAHAGRILAVLAAVGIPNVEVPSTGPSPQAEPEPVETVSSEPAPPTNPAEPVQPEITAPLTGEGFATYSFGTDEAAPAAVGYQQTGDGILLTWPPADSDDAIVIYRVVLTTQESGLLSPDDGELIEVTREVSALDRLVQDWAVRRITVWVNSGADVASAKRSQPRMHATATFIAPVTDAHIVDDYGAVIGSWRTPRGAERVVVHRIPADLAPGIGYNPAYEINRGSPNTTGIEDYEAQRGRRYVYRIYVVAGADHAASVPVSVEVSLGADLEAVTDLSAETYDHNGIAVVRLTWTKPTSGEVKVYRTQEPPPRDAEGEASLTTEMLTSIVGLRDPLPYHPTESATPSGRTVQSMPRVTWPTDWNEVSFTPVTHLGDLARVGTSVTRRRLGTISEPRLTQRVDWQHLTFGWPEGAAEVAVFVTKRGDPLPDQPDSPEATITRSVYEDQGGLQLSLPTERGGIDVHLVPRAYSGGRAGMGSGATLPYDGILVFRYEFEWTGMGRRRWELRLSCRSDTDLGLSPGPFEMVAQLVFNPNRLPLSAQREEGTALCSVTFPPRMEAGKRYALQLDDILAQAGRGRPAPGGWIRLVMNAPHQAMNVALLDPPVEQLRT